MMPISQDDAPAPTPVTEAARLDWWHRDHPTFTALTGFFSGLALVVVIPGAFLGLLHLVFGNDIAERVFPFALLVLLVPAGLVIAPRTRRFGIYMLIGGVVTGLVVGGAATVVLWFLITHEG
jgi:hypothetical protein